MSTFGLIRGAAVLRKSLCLLGAAALLAACGGGSQLVPFEAQRVLVFGDEISVITANGRKYSVNAVLADNVTFDCANNPIWVQTVANAFGLVFPECNPSNVAAPRSRILAAPGAKVADLQAQVTAHLASDTFGDKDLVTMLVGQHDVLAIYAQYPTITVAQAREQAEAAGAALAVQVNRVANLGGKVLLGKVLDLGQTPFGLAEKADPNKQDTDRAALLSTLAARFNARLRVDIQNDGRKIGLVQTDERIQNVVSFASDFGFTNVTQAACLPSVALPDCTSQTLTTTPDSNGNLAGANRWLWADSLRLSAGGQFRLGEIGASVARNNPF